MIVTSWNCRVKNWIYVVLSRVRTLDRLLLVNKLDDDLIKYLISDVLKRGEEILSNLSEEFRIDINWEIIVGLVSLSNKRKTITIIVEK